MASDGFGGFYMCGESPVYYVDPEGFTHFIAGASDRGYAGDGGPATQALLTQPWDVAVDRDGNLFIADTNNNRIRRVDKQSGIITTVAGGGPLNGFEGYGHGSFCGDGGPALQACFNTPFSLGVDPFGDIFISDYYNGRLRKVDARGIITTLRDMTGQGSFGKILTDAYGGLFVQRDHRFEWHRDDELRRQLRRQRIVHCHGAATDCNRNGYRADVRQARSLSPPRRSSLIMRGAARPRRGSLD